MGTPFLSEIRIVSFGFAPKGWGLTNGQVLPINQNQALFSLIGTFYGGNGQTTFQLPNLQSRIPMHVGQGAGLTPRTLGAYGGVEAITQQATPIPQTPASPKTAFIGAQSRLGTVSPFLVLNFVIALQGIFPSRN
jgi:microcystin-dependent protein